MSDNPSYPNKNPRILMLSLRGFEFHVSRCFTYEFEDIICNTDAVDICTPTYSRSLLKRVSNRLARRTFETTGRGAFLNPLSNQISIKQEYDLFFVICQNPLDLLYLNSVKDWRKKCHKAICWLDEIWLKDIEKWKTYLELLKDFDYVFMSFSSSMNAVANVVQRPLQFMPPGVDAIRFCPYPLQPYRNVDIYVMGRRSPVVHEALLRLAEQKGFLYIYDTIRDLFTTDCKHHRSLSSNLIKRSRYFIANKPLFKCESTTGGQEELSTRFFEGAAGGAVILGSPPACNGFHTYFDWPDAVIPISYDAADIADVIAVLDTQPERLVRIRTDNVVNSLLRHDWVYRWEKILETVGLECTSQMLSRKACLSSLAEMVRAHAGSNIEIQQTLS